MDNKNPALRGRQIIGIYVFRGLKPSGTSWTGTIYNPEDGGTYKATGKSFRTPFVHVWRLQNGALVKFRQHTDTALVQAALR